MCTQGRSASPISAICSIYWVGRATIRRGAKSPRCRTWREGSPPAADRHRGAMPRAPGSRVAQIRAGPSVRRLQARRHHPADLIRLSAPDQDQRFRYYYRGASWDWPRRARRPQRIGLIAGASDERNSSLVHDVFGTVVDWRSGVTADGRALGARAGGSPPIGSALPTKWRGAYAPSMNRVRTGELPWTPSRMRCTGMALDQSAREIWHTGLDEATSKCST